MGRQPSAHAHHDREPVGSLKVAKVLQLKAKRLSRSAIARRLGIGRTAVRRILAAG